ncbi:MAG: DciA family protein [Phycisphaerales bacterium JB065]
MNPRQAQNQLQRRQDQIEARSRRVEVSGLFATTQRELQRTEKRLAGSSALWERVCPPELLERTCVVGLQRGTLTIGVRDHSTRYVLDRLLRSGLEDEVRRRSAVSVSTVKLVARPEAFVDPKIAAIRDRRASQSRKGS